MQPVSIDSECITRFSHGLVNIVDPENLGLEKACKILDSNPNFQASRKPEPAIKWWREGKLIESTETRSGFEKVRSNQLIVRGLQRSDQHAAFTCQASNNNISQPVSATTSIEIHFRPLTVEILISNNPFSADRKYDIPCQSFGSRPPAKITWIMDGKELLPPKYNATYSDSEDGNSTTSILSFVPTRLDNGRSLTCRASNHLVQNGVEEHTVKLNVFCKLFQ
ncbi:synaptogenesis protein syg-2-like [Diabrotica virgifera virgifera]|uniref:Ig-like domain-containing protein n=1 Tax=Diabrotica virgifera virgifera TaxID=50390 RepID=A0ABM5KFB4_DIAVI|nr:synaptogenesis protein syg-2-like [Diabrotica virgifera virgifera]